MPKNIYVSNISCEVTESELNDLFAPFGTVNTVTISTDRDSGISRGFGLIEMFSIEAGDRAIKELNGRQLHNSAINVKEARSQMNREGFRDRGRPQGWSRPRGWERKGRGGI
jgi:RNA recognition motif-containing protein